MIGESINSKALILLTSRPMLVEIAVMEMGSKVLGVTFSQEILLGVAARCSDLGTEGVESPTGWWKTRWRSGMLSRSSS